MGNFKETMTISMLAIFSLFISCQGQQSDTSKPNVILIMADDIGFECLSINGLSLIHI